MAGANMRIWKSRRRRGVAGAWFPVPATLVGVVVLAFAAGGCSSSSNKRDDERVLKIASEGMKRDVSDRIRSDVMGFADTHAARVMPMLDSLLFSGDTDKDAGEPSRAIHDYAIKDRLGTMTSSLSIVMEPNPFIAMLDMVVMITLKRANVEEYAVPNILHDRGAALLDAYRRSEQDVWAMASRYLSEQQIDELRTQIRDWRAQNPQLYYVGFVRFSDFGSYRQAVHDIDRPKPGSVFGLLYVDPLANLDPVARELANYRSLTERMAFLATRLPIVIGCEVQHTMWQATNDPGFRSFIASTAQFSAATERFAIATENYPKDLTKERQAAVEQLAAAVTVQREGLWKDIELQEGRIRSVLADARGVTESAAQAATTISDSARAAVDSAGVQSRQTIDRAFWLGLTLLLVCLVGVPVSALAYRRYARRLPGPAPSESN